MIRDLANSGVFPQELLNFGSGSLFTLPGRITLGLQHPLALAMLGIFAVGATSTAVAGERARGTLEVLLARPISRIDALRDHPRRRCCSSCLLVLARSSAAWSAGRRSRALSTSSTSARLPLVLLNGFGLWAAFTTFGLAASVSFDRPGPAIGLSLA